MAAYKPGVVIGKGGGRNGRVFVRILKSSEYRQADMFFVMPIKNSRNRNKTGLLP